MSIAIRFGDTSDPSVLSGAIYFDAVTQYSKNLSGRVTEHPLEAGASITDHFISSNPKYDITGFISSVDFSNIPSVLLLDGEGVINNSPQPSPVSVQDIGALRRFIPGVLDQFFGQTSPSIQMERSERMNYKLSIENFFEILMSGLSYNEKRKKWENRMTTATLYELQGSTAIKPIPDLVVVSVRVEEDEETGDSLPLSISLEKVNFVTLEKAEAPKAQKNTPTERGAADKTQMGSKPSTVNDPKNPPNDSPTVIGEIEKTRR